MGATQAGKYELEEVVSEVVPDTRLEGVEEEVEASPDALDTESQEPEDAKTEVTEPEGDETPVEAKPEEGEVKEEASAEEDEFGIPPSPGPDPLDLGDGKVLKHTDFKDQVLFEKVSQGFMRTADYTKKTQEHAELVRGAGQIWDFFNGLRSNPQAPLEQHFTDGQLLGALKRRGFEIDPALLENKPAYGVDPAIEQKLRYLEDQNKRFGQMLDEREKEKSSHEISSAVESVIADIKNDSAKELIRQKTYGTLLLNNNADVRSTALKMREEVRQYYSALRAKKESKNGLGTRVSKGKGGVVPARRSAMPQTWDDIK